jgi:IclR family transcriptional regulator, pca regulon regulatory protein
MKAITPRMGVRSDDHTVPEEPDAGFAVNDEEVTHGLYAIAAPIRDEAHEVVAAVNMAVHSSMISLEELVDALGPHLVSTADRLSARLGFRREDEL